MSDETKAAAAADDAELEVMVSITTAMKMPLTDEQRQLVVDWFATKYGAARPPSAAPASPEGSGKTGTSKSKTGKKRRTAAVTAAPGAAAASPNKPKGAARPDKDLDLSPAGKKSFRDFVAEKQPADNAYEHNVVALYWLTQEADVGKATADQVFSCYREAKWKLPADLRNSLQVTASTKTWMDTKDTDELRMTSQGINFVERDLPRTPKAGK